MIISFLYLENIRDQTFRLPFNIKASVMSVYVFEMRLYTIACYL